MEGEEEVEAHSARASSMAARQKNPGSTRRRSSPQTIISEKKIDTMQLGLVGSHFNEITSSENYAATGTIPLGKVTSLPPRPLQHHNHTQTIAKRYIPFL